MEEQQRHTENPAAFAKLLKNAPRLIEYVNAAPRGVIKQAMVTSHAVL